MESHVFRANICHITEWMLNISVVQKKNQIQGHPLIDMFAFIHNRHGMKLDNKFSNFPSSTMKYECHDKHRRSPHLVVDKSVLLVMLFRLR